MQKPAKNKKTAPSSSNAVASLAKHDIVHHRSCQKSDSAHRSAAIVKLHPSQPPRVHRP